MTLGTQENSQNPCVTGAYPPEGGQPLLTTTRLGLPATPVPALTAGPHQPRCPGRTGGSGSCYASGLLGPKRSAQDRKFN